jgi:hypothetical protein
MAFPSVYNFPYYRGDTYDFILRPKNNNAEPFDLEEFDKILFTIATAPGETGLLVGKAEAVINASANYINCRIPSEFGTLMSGASYVYDIEITDTSSSTTYTLLTGRITVTQDVSGRVS